MSGQKVVIVVIVAVVMLFVITFALNSRDRDSGDPNEPPDLVEALKGLQSDRFIILGDGVTTTCDAASETQITVSGPCSIAVGELGFFSAPRRAAVQVLAGITVIAVAGSEGEEPDQVKAVAAPDCVETGIDRSGAVILFQNCIAGPCAVQLRQSACES